MRPKKKGVSLMVSYTILVVIGIVLSVAVYSFLRLNLPPQREECPSNVNLIIEDATCSVADKTISLVISNRGLFNVSAAFIRMGQPDRIVKPQVNAGGVKFPNGPLGPGDETPFMEFETPFDVNDIDTYTIEVQPAIIVGRNTVPCEAIVEETVVCS